VRRVEREAVVPRDEHLAARVRVLLEEPTHARRELHAPDIERLGSVTGRVEVGPQRRQVRLGHQGVVEEEGQRHRLQRLRVGHARAAVERRRRLSGEPGEQRCVEVRGDPLLARDSEAHVALDAPVRNDEPHGDQRALSRLLRAHPRRQLGEQLFGSVRVDEADQGRRPPPTLRPDHSYVQQ
jgi:hypothetical protein